ncbi:MAG TPA: molybdopterin molybdotransferase MoeA, partial [Nitrososphaerales archaeon]|nr:molybdopterin molybdotransferase MoeA [Nitrososphaerales archaeon]
MQSQFQYTPLKDALLTLAGELGQRSRIESVNVREGYGRILAEDVLAGEDSPRSDVSHFDGFALRSEDTFGAKEGSQISLALRRGAGRPGLPAKRKLGTGEAMKVLTGGFLPPGADAIVPLEDSSVLAHEIQLTRPVHPGEHVYRAGSDVKKGDRILQAGKQLMGQDLVLLASLHIGAVAAYRRPRVAVLPTGSELTRDISGGRKGKVVESHSLLLELLIEGAGGLPTTLPIARDERRTLTRAIREAIRRSDIVFTLAGSSVGEPDLVESTIRGFGKATTALVHGVRVNRGRVMGFAIVKGKPVVILP